MLWRRLGCLVAWLVCSGCASAGAPLAPLSASDTHGEEIYRGAVFKPGADQVFRYARYSSRTGPRWSSTHVSHAVSSGELAIVQRATHDDAYELQAFRESDLQRGIETAGQALAGGGMRFEVRKGGRTKTRTEGAGAPYVVGPTLFGFATAHWDALVAGEAVDVRFVVADRARSYGFSLTLASTTAQHTVIVMTAKRPMVRAMVAPMRLTFDTASRNIVRYEGRIPPQVEGKPLDARVEYEHTAARFF